MTELVSLPLPLPLASDDEISLALPLDDILDSECRWVAVGMKVPRGVRMPVLSEMYPGFVENPVGALTVGISCIWDNGLASAVGALSAGVITLL
jgi:hypothetical protein